MITIRIIDWKEKEIRDITVERITYEKKGIVYPVKCGNLTNFITIPYQNFLGVRE